MRSIIDAKNMEARNYVTEQASNNSIAMNLLTRMESVMLEC